MARKDPAAALADISRRYRELCQALSGTGFIASGSVTQRYTHCNRPGCRCGADPPALHGPYWQWTAKVAGRTVTKRLSAAEAAVYQEQIANDRQLRAVIEQMRSVAGEARELILAADGEEARRSP
jgi:hypothetical protein